MSDVTMYGFENAQGCEETFTTFNAIEAKEHGQKWGLRVIAHTFIWDDSEVAWDFTPQTEVDDETPVGPGDTEEVETL